MKVGIFLIPIKIFVIIFENIIEKYFIVISSYQVFMDNVNVFFMWSGQ